MIDFESLVESLLNEVEEVIQTTSSSSDLSYGFFAETKINNNQTPYELFNSAYQKIYKKPVLQSTNDLKTLISTIRQSADKNQLTIKPFERYVEAFPLVDFILYVVQKLSGKNKALFNDFEKNLSEIDIDEQQTKIINEYIEYFNKQAKENGWPLDYPALTVQARMLESGLRKKLTENVIGELALEKYLKDPKASIYATVMGLLSARKKVRDPMNIVPAANSFINDILYGNINSYAGGGQLIKGKYARLYDKVSVEKLLELGNAIRKYYNNQVTQFASDTIKPNNLEIFVKNTLKGGNFVFEKCLSNFNKNVLNYYRILTEATGTSFIINGPDIGDEKTQIIHDKINKTITVINRTQNQEIAKISEEELLKLTGLSSPTASVLSLSKNNNNSFNSLLQNTATQSSSESEQTQTDTPSNIADSSLSSSEQAQTDTPSNTADSSLSSSEQNISIPKGGYTLANIDIQSKSGNDSAKDLIDKIRELGDYIREGEPTDWSGKLGAATQIAQSAMLGTKMAGT